MLLGLLFVSVGPAFFVVATSSPLLQAWYAAIEGKTRKDPYWLYAASNAGSLVALLTDTPPPSAPVSLMYAQNRQLSPRLRAFSDWLAHQFRKGER